MAQNIKIFECTICDYKTNKKYNLTRHMVTKHAAEKVVENAEKVVENAENKCDKCSKIFSRKSHLKVHLETCKGVKDPLKCEFCNKIFSNKSNRYNHQKICKEKNKQLSIVNNITNNNVTNNIINNNITNINLNLNFNNAPYIGLTEEIAMKHINQGAYGVIECINNIYFKDDLQRLIELYVDRTKTVKILENGKWKFESLDKALRDMQKNSINQVCDKANMDEINKCLDEVSAVETETTEIPPLLASYYEFKSPSKSYSKKIKSHTLTKLNIQKYKDNEIIS